MPSMRTFLKNLTPQVSRTSKLFTTNHEIAHAAELIPRVENHVKQYMSKFDASHDFAHIRRVVRRAHVIHDEIIADAAGTNQPVPQYDMTTITLSALLHDVGDRKYVNLRKENPKTMINTLLLDFGANTELAVKIQAICSAVMLESIDLLDWKLLKLQPLVRTGPGRRMAQEATARLEVFKRWWVEEVAIEDRYEPRITQ